MKEKFLKLTKSDGTEVTLPVSDIAHISSDGDGVAVEYGDGDTDEYAESYSYVKKLIVRTYPGQFIEFVTSSATYYVNTSYISYVTDNGGDPLLGVIEFVDGGTMTTDSELYGHLTSRIKKYKPTGFVSLSGSSNDYFINVNEIASISGNGGDPEKAVVVTTSGDTLTADSEEYTYFTRKLTSIGYRNFSASLDITGFGDVTFTVVDPVNSDAAVEDASITFSGETKLTDASGQASFNNVDFGSGQEYTVSKDGWVTYTGTVTVDGDEAVGVNLTGLSEVTVTVEDGTTTAIEGASVTITSDGETYSGTTDSSGEVVLSDVHYDATANISVTADGYVDNTTNAIDIDSATETATITMTSA